MTPLYKLAKLIRSKNAGPFELTIDVMFEDEPTYRRVLGCDVIRPELFESLYGVPQGLVSITPYDPAYAIKITIPRPYSSGGVDDVDVAGGQQYAPLVEVDIPESGTS